MTENHPITPPPELILQWNQNAIGTHFRPYGYSEYIATQSARWGADQELDACIDVILAHPGLEHPELLVEVLRAIRRPKPPSLKEQALNNLADAYNADKIDDTTYENLRLALEALPDG